MNRKKLLIGIILALVVAGAVVAGVILTRQRQELRTSADPATTLTITPTLGNTVELGENLVANVEIDTNENAVVIADMVITFDPTKLQAQSIVPGTFFANPQEQGPSIDNSLGRIEYAVFIPVGAVARQGTGTVATITFNTIDVGDAEIAFGPETTVGAFEEESNVLISSTPTTVTIIPAEDTGGGDPTATPTEEPTGGDPTPTATATSAAQPTPTPTSTSTGGTGDTTGVGGASPTATATPRTTATPTTASGSGATTPPTSLPDSGFGAPTIIIGAVGVILVVGSLLFLTL